MSEVETVEPRQRTRNNGNTTDWGSGMDARTCKLLARSNEGRQICEVISRGATFNYRTRYSPTIFPLMVCAACGCRARLKYVTFATELCARVPKEIVTQDWVPSEICRRTMDGESMGEDGSCRFVMQV